MVSYKILPKIVFLVLLGLSLSISAQDTPVLSLQKITKKPSQTVSLAPGKMSIAGTATSSKNYRTLLAIIKASGFEDLLDGTAPFTVFAPSDIAFKGFQDLSVEDWLNSKNTEELKNLLGYHIVAGKLSASRILRALSRGEGKATFTTLQGDIITATMKGIDIILSDSYGNEATIVVADSNQSNGVIHEIDAVIRPAE